MDSLLYGSEHEAALRAARRLGSDEVALAKARIAAYRKAPNTRALLEAVPRELRGDAGDHSIGRPDADQAAYRPATNDGDRTNDESRESIQSYVLENVDLAYKMAKDDDMVDALYSQIIRELFTIMMENPVTISQANLLSFVGRYLERFADHATNIGESVVYLVTGVRPDLNS